MLERTDVSQNFLILRARGTNARVGDACDGKLVDSGNFEECEEDIFMGEGLLTKPRAKNEDSLINANGEEILTWARGMGLWILNGRVIRNDCTFFSQRGKFNCDTWLCSEDSSADAVAGSVSGPLIMPWLSLACVLCWNPLKKIASSILHRLLKSRWLGKCGENQCCSFRWWSSTTRNAIGVC